MSTSAALDDSRATSRSLIARVQGGEAEAWNRLVAIYAPFVLQHCRRATRSEADAADVFQDVFQAAFAKIATFSKRAPGDTFRGWLRTITRNKVNDHFRRLAREQRGAGGTEVQILMSQVEARSSEQESSRGEVEELHLFRQTLDSIRHEFRERTWKAFLGTALDGRTPLDVGEELSMSPAAVRVAKSRVLQRLRSELGDRSS